MEVERVVSRRRHSAELKALVLEQCAVSGASVAKVAMSHGINTNVVHGWRKLAREAAPTAIPGQQAFLPIPLPQLAEQAAPERSIEAELRRGALTMKITWPASATVDFAAWTRELLR